METLYIYLIICSCLFFAFSLTTHGIYIYTHNKALTAEETHITFFGQSTTQDTILTISMGLVGIVIGVVISWLYTRNKKPGKISNIEIQESEPLIEKKGETLVANPLSKLLKKGKKENPVMTTSSEIPTAPIMPSQTEINKVHKLPTTSTTRTEHGISYSPLPENPSKLKNEDISENIKLRRERVGTFESITSSRGSF